MKNIYLYLLFSVTLVSCSDFFDTTIEIDPPEFEEMMVASVFLNMSKQEGKMTLTKNKPVLSNLSLPELEISDAEVVTRFDNGAVNSWDYVGPISFDYINYYIDDFVTDNAESVTLEVKSSEFPNGITATSIVPTKVTPYQVVLEIDGGLDIEGDESSNFEISFQDPPGEQNFYEVAIGRGNRFDDQLYTDYAQTLDQNAVRGANWDALLYDDSQFNGEQTTMTLQIGQLSPDWHDYSRLFVVFKSVTEDYFIHSKTSKQQNDTQDNPFASPTQVFSNIEGGVGILSVYHEAIIEVLP